MALLSFLAPRSDPSRSSGELLESGSCPHSTRRSLHRGRHLVHQRVGAILEISAAGHARLFGAPGLPLHVPRYRFNHRRSQGGTQSAGEPEGIADWGVTGDMEGSCGGSSEQHVLSLLQLGHAPPLTSFSIRNLSIHLILLHLPLSCNLPWNFDSCK